MYATTLIQNHVHQASMNLGLGFSTQALPYSKSIWYFESLEDAKKIQSNCGGKIFHVVKPLSTLPQYQPKELFVVFKRMPKNKLFACEYVYGFMQEIN